MIVKNIEIKNKIALAPLAGYTNLSYRKIMKEVGVGLVFSEMISARGLLYDNDKTWDLTKINDDEHPIGMQIFGGDVDSLVAAAKMIDTQTAADIIDINMGCPVRKVLKAEAGSYLLQDPNKIEEIVRKIVQAVNKPVSVKIRAGWDHQSINCVEIAKRVEKAGASLITIHGRTKSDIYSGKVNLDYIKSVKDSVSIPVIGNGDIRSIEDGIKMFEYTNVDMIMVGRGSLGNPWLIRDLVDYFSGKPVQPAPSALEKIEMCEKHFKYLLEEKVEKLAVLEMRSLAAWYVKGIKNSKEFKQKLISITRKEELFAILDELKKELI